MIVQACWRATKVAKAQPPYDTIQLKVFYPEFTSDSEQTSSANGIKAPFPVVIFFSGVNCNLAMYEWLALDLVPRGLVVVLFNWLGENIPGNISLTPGIDTTAFSRDIYGTVPSALALPPILDELEKLNKVGLLAGLLDLQKIILGGHSAGGRVALENANTEFFSQVSGAFSYGGHTAAPTKLQYEPGTILSLSNSVPMLLIAGTHDGVIAKNSHNYGIDQWETPATPVIRTFREAISRKQGDSYLVVLEGANHFSVADPLDSTLKVASLDFTASQSGAKIRSVIGSVIGLFIDLHVRQSLKISQPIEQLLEDNNTVVNFFECK